MLISVFNSPYFDTSGIRVDDVGEYDWSEKRDARIIFGKYSTKNPMYGHSNHPVPENKTVVDCIIIEGKTKHEVAAAINAELKKIGKP